MYVLHILIRMRFAIQPVEALNNPHYHPRSVQRVSLKLKSLTPQLVKLSPWFRHYSLYNDVRIFYLQVLISMFLALNSLFSLDSLLIIIINVLYIIS